LCGSALAQHDGWSLIVTAPQNLREGRNALTFRPLGPPTDVEAERVEWVPIASAPALIAWGEIVSSSTMTGLLYLMMTG
jgi:hypothetical protein